MANLTNVNINGALIRKEGTLSFSPQSNMFPQPHTAVGTSIWYASSAVDPNNANKLVVAYRDMSDGNKGKLRIGTIQTNNSIVWGADENVGRSVGRGRKRRQIGGVGMRAWAARWGVDENVGRSVE